MTENIGDETFPLRDVIRGLRDEIAQAALDGAGNAISFALGPIELEFNVVATREGGGGGGIKFAVLGIGANVDASAKVANERTQKVKFTLTPEMLDPTTGLRGPARISSVPGASTVPGAR